MTLSPLRNRVFIIVFCCWSIYCFLRPCLPTGELDKCWLIWVGFCDLFSSFFYGWNVWLSNRISKSDFYCLLLLVQSKKKKIFTMNDCTLFSVFLLKYFWFCWILPFQLLNMYYLAVIDFSTLILMRYTWNSWHGPHICWLGKQCLPSLQSRDLN